MNDYEANVAYRQVEQANDFNNLGKNLVFLLKSNQLTGQFNYDANQETFDWHGFPENTNFDVIRNMQFGVLQEFLCCLILNKIGYHRRRLINQMHKCVYIPLILVTYKSQ